MVRLDPVTGDNFEAVAALAVAPGQEDFVATNLWSLAEAYVEYDIAWPRAIVAGDTVVGFLMLDIDPDQENGQPFWLQRLMIDAPRQRQGYGRAALDLVVEHIRLLGAQEFYTSWVPSDVGPEPFYVKYGFEPTGDVEDGEVVARLDLTD